MARIPVYVPDLNSLETVSDGDRPAGRDASGDESPDRID